MRTIWHDIRFGLRQLCKSPGFTAIAVLSLALGIGANTAIFSLINGILLKSLPVRNPQELRLINWTSNNWPFNRAPAWSGNAVRTKSGKRYSGSFSYPAYRDFAEQAQGFSDLFAFSYPEDAKTINVGGISTLTNPLMVSGNFFKGYGAQVLIGRPITPEDDRADAPPVAVLTYPFWRRVYGLDPHVLGQTLTVGQTGFTVIGVLPRSYVSPLAGEVTTDFYVPMIAQRWLTSMPEGKEDWLSSNELWWVQIMGRLAPNANEAQVRASLELIFARVLSRSRRVMFDQPEILLEAGHRGMMINRREMAQPLWLLQGVAGLVLLIACTNLAGLLLARGAARQHEMAVRAAMGAGRWRLIRQSLTESLILSLAGVCLGLIFSFWIKATLLGLVIDPSENLQLNLEIDATVLLVTLVIGVVTTLLSGLVPALRVGGIKPLAGLKDSGSRGAPRLRLGKMLVTAQVGLSILVVIGAGLLSRTLVNLYRTNLGFDAESLLLVPINPSKSLSPPKDALAFYATLRQEIAGIPGVRSVALSHQALLKGVWVSSVSIPSRSGAKQYESHRLVVSDGYFATMGISLLAGRDFSAADTRDSEGVVIVNEAFARRFFPDENPVGQYIRPSKSKERQIVGLCSNHKIEGLRQSPYATIYIPHSQHWSRSYMTCVIRSALPPMSLVPAVRDAVNRINHDLPLEGITTQKLVIEESLRLERLYVLLCGSLASLALLLSCIGLYGIMAYNVARRTNEMGIRKALGARPWDVAWPIMRGALILTAIGITIGLPVTLALVRLIESLVYGIDPHDPLTLIGSVVLMVTVAALAAWIPARRAAMVDPMEALRYE